MPTTGNISGNMMGIFVDDNLIACATAASLDITTAMSDATCKDNDGAEQVKPSQLSWNMSSDANFAFDAAYGPDDLIALMLAKTAVTVKLTTYNNPGDEAPVTGDSNYSGTAYIENFTINAPLNEVTTYSVSFKGSGPLAVGTNL